MKRIVVAFLIALVGISISWFKFRPKEWTTSGGLDRAVMARVIEIYNDVNRQEDGRLLWAPLRAGDTIFLGDKIKTSGLSSVSLQFLNTSSKLEIEENTTVKIEGIGKKLALNMMEGRVFLKQDSSSEENKVEVISGGKKIALDSNASLSVNQDGSSQVDNFNASSEGIFQDLSPHYGEEVLARNNSIWVNWKPMERSEDVFVESGESPVLLSPQPNKITFKDGKLLVAMRPGINYWRLVTKLGANEVRSSLMRLSLTRPLAPVPIFPAQGEVINLKDKTFEFKWALGNMGEQMELEVSKDSSFKVLFEAAGIKNQTFYMSGKFYDQGDYFWRIKSKLPGTQSWVESETFSFKILHGENLLSPLPISPKDGMTFYVGDSEPVSVRFEWKNQESARSYEFAVQGTDDLKKQQVAQAFTEINLSKAGKYNWYVTSESSAGKISSFPAKSYFEVKNFQKISWKNQSKFFYYLDNFPIIILEWSKYQDQSFILKISTRSDMSDSETFQVRGKDFPYRPSSEGFHYAKILSIDSFGQISGESEVYEFKIEKAPLPPIPLLGDQSKVMASSRGDLSLEVKNQKTNWTISSRVMSAKGMIIDERSFPGPVIKFTGLLPGNYTLQTVFQDQYQRKSESPSVIEVVVPDKSLIAAPKIKGIKVR